MQKPHINLIKGIFNGCAVNALNPTWVVANGYVIR